jgi:hypothetical protein
MASRGSRRKLPMLPLTFFLGANVTIRSPFEKLEGDDQNVVKDVAKPIKELLKIQQNRPKCR